MGGFFSDLLTSTFDPRYGMLGRPVSGALRSALDIGSQMDPFKYIERGAGLLGIPGADTLIKEREKRERETNDFLDRYLGAGLGVKMIREPTQQMAEEMLGVDYGREVPLGELFESAVFPEKGRGDFGETAFDSTMTPSGPITKSRPMTSEDVDDALTWRHQIGGGVESVGNLGEIAPELALIPSAPGIGMAFIPGVAESLGTNLGRGEYGKAVIDALFGLGIAGHTSRLARGIAPGGIEDVADISPREAYPAEKMTAFPGESKGTEIPEITRQRNITEQFLDRVKDTAANTLNDPKIKDIELVPDTSTFFDLEGNQIHYNLADIHDRPEAIVHEIAHTLAEHEFPGISSEGPGRAYSPIGEGKFAEVDPSLQFHTEANIPERAKYSSEEHQFQTAYESLMNHPDVITNLDRFRSYIKKPIEEFKAGEVGDIPTTPIETTANQSRALPEGEKPPEPKEWRITFNDGSTKFVKALDRGEAAKLTKEAGLPEGATKIAGISERTPDMSEGAKREGIRKSDTTFIVKMSDGSTRKVRAYSEESARNTVAKAQEAANTGLTVDSIEEKTKRVPKGPKFGVKHLEALGRVLEGKKAESPEITAARKAVLEAISPSKAAETPTTLETPTLETPKPTVKEVKQEGPPPRKGQPKIGRGKEKPEPKNFTVVLSDGYKETVKATSPKEARETVEKIIEAEGSHLGVKGVEEKITKLQAHLRTKKAKGPSELSPEEAKLSEKIAREQEKETLDLAKKEAAEKKKTEEVDHLEKGLVDDLTDIPKTLKFAFDVSWLGRQGLFLLNRPKALKGMLKGTATAIPFTGRELHERIKTELAERPNAELYEKAGLNQYKYDPTEITKISQRMEEIPSERAAKLPGIRHSTRAFEDAANLARANMFDHFAEKFEKLGKTFETHPDLYKKMADYLNVLTMRKPLPKKLQQAGWILNKMFVSPMAIYSRLTMINPLWYAKLPKEMKLEAARDIGGTIATIAALLGATKIAASQAGLSSDDVDINFDPAHTDFGKLRIGHTSLDFSAGLIPLVRTLYRITSGRKATRKGEYKLPGSIGYGLQEDLKDAPFRTSAFSEINQFIENKKSPLYQAYKGITSGKGWYGEDYGFAQLLTDLFMPLSLEDPIKATTRYGLGEAAKQLPGVFGVGTMLEPPEKKKKKKKGKKNRRYPF